MIVSTDMYTTFQLPTNRQVTCTLNKQVQLLKTVD